MEQSGLRVAMGTVHVLPDTGDIVPAHRPLASEIQPWPSDDSITHQKILKRLAGRQIEAWRADALHAATAFGGELTHTVSPQNPDVTLVDFTSSDTHIITALPNWLGYTLASAIEGFPANIPQVAEFTGPQSETQ